MKSPIRWGRRKTPLRKEPNSLTKVTVTNQASNDDDALGKADSCDATDCVASDGSVLTGETSHRYWMRVAVDPPEWTPQNTEPSQSVDVQRSAYDGEVSRSTRHSSNLAYQSNDSQLFASTSTNSGSCIFRGSHPRADDTSGIFAANSDTPSNVYYGGDVTPVSSGSGRNERIPRPATMQESNESALKPTDNLKISYTSSSTSTSSSSSNSSSSMPPPGFALPRKEICDTIKYHHKLGKILSKLALDPDMKSMDDNGVSGAKLPLDVSTNQRENRTNNSFPLNGLQYTDSVHKLENILSKLVLDKEMKPMDDNGGNDAKLSLCASTSREILSNNSSPLNGLRYTDSLDESGASKQRIIRPLNPRICKKKKETPNLVAQWVFNFENVVNQDVDLERAFSMESAFFSDFSSSHCSSNTDRAKKLEEHLSFLENHVINQISSFDASPTDAWPAASPTSCCHGDWDSNNTSSDASFFPEIDALRSPSICTPAQVMSRDAADMVPPHVSSMACKNSLSPMNVTSLVKTGSIGDLESTEFSTSKQEEVVNDSNCVDNHGLLHQQGFENACCNLVRDLQRIKDETAAVMMEVKDEIRTDIKKTIDEQMQQHHSRIKVEVSAMSERLENAAQAAIKAMENSQTFKENEIPQPSSSSFPRKRLQSPSLLRHSTDMSSYDSKTPDATASINVINCEVLLKQLDKSLLSMEASILDKLTAQINKDADRQQRAIEVMIEEKVSKVIAGSNLEMNMAVQAVKAETERVSKLALRDRTPPPVRTPPRTGIVRSQSSISPIRPARNFSSSKCSGGDKSWIKGNSSSVIKDAKEGPQKSLEDSFTETMNVIDEFVADCDDIVNDFDKIAFRMQDTNISLDSDSDNEV
jgi:hypothetical protein